MAPSVTSEPAPEHVSGGTDINNMAGLNNTNLDPNYTILEQPIGTRRPIRVACLGAGYSGLMMGIVFNERMQDANAEFVIYERNEDLGGTWFENQ